MNHPIAHDNLNGAVETLQDNVISVEHVTKRFAMFSKPEDRLKQMFIPRLQRFAGAAPSKYFNEFTAVKDVSLNIKRGETIGIIGRNGSGKSTLLQMIVGTLAPTSGNISVKGRIAALLELGAGFNPEFTGRENVYVNGAILGFSREEMDARFEAIAAFASIGEFIERPVKTYSSGMFVRLAFAVATAVEPDILIVDEALSVGDEAFQRKCFARIEAIKERGGTILFVSHAAQTIVHLCDRAVLLDAGEKILEGAPKDVVRAYQTLLYGGDNSAAALEPDSSPNDAAPEGIDEVKDGQTDVENEAFFDPSLISDISVISDERVAVLLTSGVYDSDGKKVNCLAKGGQYRITYEVKFLQDCFNLGFGSYFETVSGYGVSGIQSAFGFNEHTSNFSAGETVSVNVHFVWPFTAGTYSVGFAIRSGSETVLLKLRDVVLLKTASIENRAMVGFVDMKFQISVF